MWLKVGGVLLYEPEYNTVYDATHRMSTFLSIEMYPMKTNDTLKTEVK